MIHILFVCTGNTCRSSMAEGLFKDAIEKDLQLAGRITISSAGIAALGGDPASEYSVKVLRENWGIDISSHRASSITVTELKKADLVLTMTRGHRDMILSAFPWAKDKVFTLREYVQTNPKDNSVKEYDYSLDIMDPYGMPIQVYKKCAEEIKQAVEKLVVKLKSSK